MGSNIISAYDYCFVIASTRHHFYRQGMKNGNEERKLSKTALKVGIFSAVALGAAVSGFLVSRQGRRFVKDVWDGRSRSQLEDRALEALWSDRKLGRREIEVQEVEPGVVALIGRVRNTDERRRARSVIAAIKGVNEIEDRLEVRAARKMWRSRR
jgi:osmotically-inducible protein OsmY